MPPFPDSVPRPPPGLAGRPRRPAGAAWRRCRRRCRTPFRPAAVAARAPRAGADVRSARRSRRTPQRQAVVRQDAFRVGLSAEIAQDGEGHSIPTGGRPAFGCGSAGGTRTATHPSIVPDSAAMAYRPGPSMRQPAAAGRRDCAPLRRDNQSPRILQRDGCSSGPHGQARRRRRRAATARGAPNGAAGCACLERSFPCGIAACALRDGAAGLSATSGSTRARFPACVSLGQTCVR